MTTKSAVAQASGRLGYARAHHADDAERVAEAERDLAEARIARAIQERLADAPPLRPEQIDRLTALLAS